MVWWCPRKAAGQTPVPTFGDSSPVRRHTPPGLAVVVILILAACAAAGWAAVRDSDPPPVDTQGGIAGRIASG